VANLRDFRAGLVRNHVMSKIRRVLAVLPWVVALAGTGAWASPRIALVYKGPGACDEGCSDAAALVAEMAGFKAVYVGPSEKDPKLFERAAVWVQPGGQSSVVAKSMNPELKDLIRAFVKGGGAYVGFCAGGFYATDLIGTTGNKGLGLIPGRTELYHGVPDTGGAILDIQWGGVHREIYWEGGPAFYPTQSNSSTVGSPGAGVEITATYPDGTAASVRATYGAGRVYVTGLHPEAPRAWRTFYHLNDADGLDYALAVKMLETVPGTFLMPAASN
jgi:glutamine amidotransferase-like uncharacterized protein